MDSENEIPKRFDVMKPEDRAAALLTETSIWLNVAKFEQMSRVASMLSKTDFIPSRFKNHPGNCLIALDMAARMQMDPLMLMGTMYIVHGEPGFEGKFISALINNSRRYSDPIDYEWKGKPGTPEWGCRAYATRRRTGKLIQGPWVTWEMVTREGWHLPKGQPPKQQKSKWMTMPEIMFLYRAVTFFGRAYDADLLMGMKTVEEINDLSMELLRQPDGSFSAGARPTAQTYQPTAKAPASAPKPVQTENGNQNIPAFDEFGTSTESPFEKSKWFNLKSGSFDQKTGFHYHVEVHKERLQEASETALAVMRDKFMKLYNGKAWPYDQNPPESQTSESQGDQLAGPQADEGEGLPWYEDGEQPRDQQASEPVKNAENQIPVLETQEARILAGLAVSHKREYVMIVRNRIPETVAEILEWINQINELVVKHAQNPPPEAEKF